MKIIGLTGPTGAGKSELCSSLARLGIPSINADKVYHRLLTPPSPCLDALTEYFGKAILKPDGSLDRRALASIVFAEGADAEHEKLNEITRDFVVKRIKELINGYASASCPAVIADVPLLFESDLCKECDITVSVLANRQVRIDRIIKRDGLDYAAANARVSAQQTDDYYISRSDIVIYNNDSDGAALDAEAKKIFSVIMGESDES